MPKPTATKETIARIEEEIRNKRLLLARLKMEDVRAKRKRQTRQKVVLAGLLIAQARTDAEAKARIAALIASPTRRQDQEVFAGVSVDDLLAIPDDLETDVREHRNLKNQKARTDG